MLTAISHVNINCSNFDRSLAFYEMLGFKVALKLREGTNPELDRGFGLINGWGKGAMLALGDNPRGSRIQLIEWRRPRSRAKPYAKLNHLGICRVVIMTTALRSIHAELVAKGVKFIDEPRLLHTKPGDALFACLYDPDGTILELIEYLPTFGRARS
jgi:glyoxylase I family protein